ncbi:hypothetical protein, partial [Salmonella sp. s55004]|uniref:hypothetical protein n=1 Tax=Salmonella sp. s55004 TaxID=3159675 RepID=UPI00397FE0B4
GMEWIIVSEEKESKFVSAVEEDLRIEGEIKRISFKSLKSRKSLLNSSKTSSRNVDCIFVWNKSDIYFDKLLRYLEQVNIESEYISRAWVIVLNPAGSSNTSNAQTITNIVRSAANVVSCPLYSMELLTNGLNGNARSKQVSDILLKQQVAHRELVLKEGEWFESKLVKLQMPELPVTETPYWELQLRHETNHSEGSKLCLSFNDNLP